MVIETQAKEQLVNCVTDQVRALLDGRLTQMRLPVRPKPQWEEVPGVATDDPALWGGRFQYQCGPEQCDVDVEIDDRRCPYGKAGDVLYVRESIRYCPEHDNFYFVADSKGCGVEIFSRLKKRFYSSAQMPRWASRFMLEVVDVRVERLHQITEEDARAEGVFTGMEYPYENGEIQCPVCRGAGVYVLHSMGGASEVDCEQCDSLRKRSRMLWNIRYEKRGFGWHLNPWTWVGAVKRVAP